MSLAITSFLPPWSLRPRGTSWIYRSIFSHSARLGPRAALPPSLPLTLRLRLEIHLIRFILQSRQSRSLHTGIHFLHNSWWPQGWTAATLDRTRTNMVSAHMGLPVWWSSHRKWGQGRRLSFTDKLDIILEPGCQGGGKIHARGIRQEGYPAQSELNTLSYCHKMNSTDIELRTHSVQLTCSPR